MGKHRLTTDWANRRNLVYVTGHAIYRVSPTRVWVGVGSEFARPGTGWDYDGYTQTDKLALVNRPVAFGDTFPV